MVSLVHISPGKSMDIKEFFRRDQFAAHCDIELLEITPGRAKTRMQIKEYHLNGLRTVHGGAIFTLADFTFAAACNSHGTVAVAINANISYMKAVGVGSILFAEATEEAVNPKIGTYAIKITDGNGDLIATFQGLAYRKKEKLDDLA